MNHPTNSLELRQFEGQEVTIKGTISNIPWQHLICADPQHPIENYFDFSNGEQIVVYSKEKLRENQTVMLTGIVVKVCGGPKRNIAGPTKVDESFIEYHVQVDSWTEI